MTQSQLFWSRLQTSAVLHTAVLAGSYNLGKDPPARLGVLALGVIVSCIIGLIMMRDIDYMKAMEGLAGSAFPKTESRDGLGKICGFTIVILLTIVEVGLFFRYA